MNLSEAVLNHYRKLWGEPVAQEEFESEEGELFPPITVGEWERRSSGIWAYATVGVSARPTSPEASEHRIELFVTAGAEAFEECSDLLMRVVETSFEGGRPLNEGDTVALREPVAPNSQMRRVWIARPLGEDDEFEWLSHDRAHVHFLMVVPIHEAEFVFLRDHDSEELWGAMAERSIPFTDFRRPPMWQGSADIAPVN